jgi:hypothetical protein
MPAAASSKAGGSLGGSSPITAVDTGRYPIPPADIGCRRPGHPAVIAAAATNDLVLAARCLGALDALDAPGAANHRTPDPASTPPSPALKQTLQEPAYATFVSEGRVGGIDLITTLYRR